MSIHIQLIGIQPKKSNYSKSPYFKSLKSVESRICRSKWQLDRFLDASGNSYDLGPPPNSQVLWKDESKLQSESGSRDICNVDLSTTEDAKPKIQLHRFLVQNPNDNNDNRCNESNAEEYDISLSPASKNQDEDEVGTPSSSPAFTSLSTETPAEPNKETIVTLPSVDGPVATSAVISTEVEETNNDEPVPTLSIEHEGSQVLVERFLALSNSSSDSGFSSSPSEDELISSSSSQVSSTPADAINVPEVTEINADADADSTDNNATIDTEESTTILDLVEEDEGEEVAEFPGPGRVLQNAQFGIYVVASQRLEPGHEICEENPLMISPKLDWVYNCDNLTEDRVCVGCYKRCSYDVICERCGWPACEVICQNAHLHKNFECAIFQQHGIKPLNLNFDYPALETLRCLLLREKDPERWEKLMRHESHVSQRQNDGNTKECREHVINFIQNSCQLREEFDDEVIENVMGIISINSFCMVNDHLRHASAIFHSISYIAHNCDPNMEVIWKFYPATGSKYDQSYFALKLFAGCTIEKGELLSHSYTGNFGSIYLPVIERQRYLANYWYFQCECGKCKKDLFKEVLDLDAWDFFSDEGESRRDKPKSKQQKRRGKRKVKNGISLEGNDLQVGRESA